MAFMELKGMFKWANLLNARAGFDKTKPPNWDITLYPEREALDKIRDLQAEGLKNVVKKDDEGYFIRFSRPIQREIKGKIVEMTPPIVSGTTDVENIGNGSKGTVTLDVYPHGTPGGGKAKAARLHAVNVEEFVARP